MNIALRRPMSLADFLVWEKRQELRYEFDGFQPYAMVGGTAAHATVQRNLVTALTNRLRGSRCQPFGSELKVEVAGQHSLSGCFRHLHPSRTQCQSGP
jgi:hypothetical protein